MNCPKCGREDAYIGFTQIDCIDPDCEHYNADHAYKMMFKDSKVKDETYDPNTDPMLEQDTTIIDFDGGSLGPNSYSRYPDLYSYDNGFSDFG